MDSSLKIENITVNYGNFTALDHVSLEIRKNTTLGLVGESGSGKSTLARVITGLITPDEGRITLGSEVLGKRRSRVQHKMIQLIFQNPDSSLNPRRTIRQILTEPLLFHRIVRRSQAEQKCKDLLARVQIDGSALGRYPHEFSGGQLQRIAIARALSVEPDILIADEPTSALDVSVQLSILKLLEALKSELNLTMLFISHDMGVIHAVSDTVAVMRQGKIVEVNQKAKFFSHPETPYSIELLSAVPKMEIMPTGGKQ